MFELIVFIPTLAISSHRFHDIGKTGGGCLINFIQVGISLIFIIYSSLPGEPRRLYSSELIFWTKFTPGSG